MTVLVLDNVATEAQLRSLLPASPSCGVIATSRRELQGPHEARTMDRYAVALLLRVLQIEPSTFYGWLAKAAAPCERDEVDRGLLSNIHEIWTARCVRTCPAPLVGVMIRPGSPVRRSEIQNSTRLPTSSRSIAAQGNTQAWFAYGSGRKGRGSA